MDALRLSERGKDVNKDGGAHGMGRTAWLLHDAATAQLLHDSFASDAVQFAVLQVPQEPLWHSCLGFGHARQCFLAVLSAKVLHVEGWSLVLHLICSCSWRTGALIPYAHVLACRSGGWSASFSARTRRRRCRLCRTPFPRTPPPGCRSAYSAAAQVPALQPPALALALSPVHSSLTRHTRKWQWFPEPCVQQKQDCSKKSANPATST